VSDAASPDDVFAILFVCTGNICRSAFAERLGQAYLDEVLGKDAGAVWLCSAGTDAVSGSRMHPDTALVLRGFGADPGDFTAQQLVPEVAADTDLVLTMTRGHRRQVLQLAPQLLHRTFTLREARDLVALLGHLEVEGVGLAERARSLVRHMGAARSRREGGRADDVPDPIGLPLEMHEEVGAMIAEAVVPVLTRIVGLREDPASALGVHSPPGSV
jgi:protein-tyrosine phosphatase